MLISHLIDGSMQQLCRPAVNAIVTSKATRSKTPSIQTSSLLPEVHSVRLNTKDWTTFKPVCVRRWQLYCNTHVLQCIIIVLLNLQGLSRFYWYSMESTTLKYRKKLHNISTLGFSFLIASSCTEKNLSRNRNEHREMQIIEVNCWTALFQTIDFEVAAERLVLRFVGYLRLRRRFLEVIIPRLWRMFAISL